MNIQTLNMRYVLLAITVCCALFLGYRAYFSVGILNDIVTNLSASQQVMSDEIELYGSTIYLSLMSAAAALLISNIERHAALIVAAFSVGSYYGCFYFVTGQNFYITFPLYLLIPFLYILILYIHGACKYHYFKKYIHLGSKADKGFLIFTILVFIYLISESATVQQANALFGEQGTYFYNYLNLMSLNYALLGVFTLTILVNRKLGLMLLLLPLSLHLTFDFMRNGGDYSFAIIPWQFYVTPILFLIVVIIRYVLLGKKQI